MPWPKRSQQHMDYVNRQVAVFACALDGCDMKPFEALLPEGNERMAEHRRVRHPDLRPAKRQTARRKKRAGSA